MTYSAEVLADSPIAYYRLNETGTTTITDSSGNGHTGTLTKDAGSFAYTQGVTGLIAGTDTATQFANHSNQGDYIDLGNSSAFRLTSAFTLEAWVKIPSGQTQFAPLIANVFSGGNVNYALGSFDTGSIESLKPSVGFYNGAFRLAQSASNLSLDVRHHLVGTWDGTILRLYVDGTEVATNTPGSSPATNTAAYRLASRWDNGLTPYFLTGVLDEVAIYGTALSAGRVTAHYVAGTTQTVTVAQATETDLAQTITRPLITVAVGQVTETDAANAFTRTKRKALAQATETDVSQTVTAGHAYAFGRATETDLAQAIADFQLHIVHQVTETDAAQIVQALRQSHGPGAGGSAAGVTDFWTVEIV